MYVFMRVTIMCPYRDKIFSTATKRSQATLQNKFYLEVIKVSCLCFPSLNPLVVLVRPGEDGSDRKERSNSECKSKSVQHFSESSIKSTFTWSHKKKVKQKNVNITRGHVSPHIKVMN